MKFVSENRPNGCPILGRFGFQKPNPIFRTSLLPRGITECNDLQLNPRPINCQSKALTTVPPNHRSVLLLYANTEATISEQYRVAHKKVDHFISLPTMCIPHTY